MTVLIVGLGSIARKHITALRQIDPSIEIWRLRLSAESPSEPEVKEINGWDAVACLKESPDFAIISNPTKFHELAIRNLLPLKCPLFIEKPVISSLESAGEISDAILEKNIITYVACNLRFHPAIRFVKEYLTRSQPRINEVNLYCGSYLPDWRPGTDYRQGYSAHPELGGGVHLDLVHEIDYCTWLFGSPEQVSSIRRSVSSLHIDSVDYAGYQLIYKQFNANISLNYYRKDPRRDLEILTENSTIHVDLLKSTITDKVKGELLFQQSFQMQDTYRWQMEHFLEKISRNEQPMNSFSEAAGVLKIALT